MKNIDLLNNNPKFIGRLTTSALNALPRANEGEMAFCTDTNEVKIYTDGAWVPMGDTGDLLKLNLYDLNKSIISQLKKLTSVDIDNIIEDINTFDSDKNNNFYMLYGKEISYFTLFSKLTQTPEFEMLGEAVIECLGEIGEVRAAAHKDDGMAFEFCVEYEDSVTCLYLFPYDSAVVGIGV